LFHELGHVKKETKSVDALTTIRYLIALISDEGRIKRQREPRMSFTSSGACCNEFSIGKLKLVSRPVGNTMFRPGMRCNLRFPRKYI